MLPAVIPVRVAAAIQAGIRIRAAARSRVPTQEPEVPVRAAQHPIPAARALEAIPAIIQEHLEVTLAPPAAMIPAPQAILEAIQVQAAATPVMAVAMAIPVTVDQQAAKAAMEERVTTAAMAAAKVIMVEAKGDTAAKAITAGRVTMVEARVGMMARVTTVRAVAIMAAAKAAMEAAVAEVADNRLL
jgi:hypothetical protein